MHSINFLDLMLIESVFFPFGNTAQHGVGMFSHFFDAQGTDLRTGTVVVSCQYILGIFFLEESIEKSQ